ncbi:MAG: pilus assembly protein PilM [Planctomycetota bacterium]
MGNAEDKPAFATPTSDAVSDPAETARDTQLRLVRDHAMPPDDDEPPALNDPSAEQPEPAAPTFEQSSASIYGARSVIGLDVGTRTLKIVHLQPSGAGIRLVNAAVKELPPPSDPDRFNVVAEAVNEFVDSATPRIRTACCVIAGDGVATVCCTMPKMNEKDLANALRWKVAEENNVDAASATVGYYMLHTKNKPGNQQVVVAAAPYHIGRLDTLFSNDTPRLSTVIPGPIAADNIMMATYHANERAPVAMLDIGAASSTLTITGEYGLEFTRKIPVGGDMVTAALAGTITLENGAVEVSRRAAEELKKKYTIGDAGTVEAAGVVVPGGRVLGAIRPVLERLVSEFVRSVQFYSQSHSLAKVGGLLLCGGGATLGGLAEYFAREARIPAGMLDPWRTLSFEVPPGLDVDPALFGPATGAAIHDNAKINLLPAHIKARRITSSVRTVSLIVTAVGLFVLTGLSWTAHREVGELKAVRQLKHESAAPMKQMAAKVAAAQELERDLAKRRAMLNALGVGRATYAAILKELSNVMPEGTYLRSLSFGTVKGVGEMRLTVDVYSMPSGSALRLKQLLTAALEDSPFFVNVSFTPLPGQPSQHGRTPDESLQLTCQVLGFPGE